MKQSQPVINRLKYICGGLYNCYRSQYNSADEKCKKCTKERLEQIENAPTLEMEERTNEVDFYSGK